MIFAQQVYGYAKEVEVLAGPSTSGNSTDIINAVKVEKSFGVNQSVLLAMM